MKKLSNVPKSKLMQKIILLFFLFLNSFGLDAFGDLPLSKLKDKTLQSFFPENTPPEYMSANPYDSKIFKKAKHLTQQDFLKALASQTNPQMCCSGCLCYCGCINCYSCLDDECISTSIPCNSDQCQQNGCNPKCCPGNNDCSGNSDDCGC